MKQAGVLGSLSKHEIEQLDWYYVVELKPGCFTNGRRYPNVLPTWKLLQRVDLHGLEVLDIGTMEGMLSVLAARAGARVTSYDRNDLSDRIALVQEAYGVDFDYHAGQPFHEFARGMHRTFDVVLFCGVLYHTIDPTVFLYMVRTLLKPGGLLLLETSAAISSDAALFLNKDGRFFASTNYYQPSTEWLDYMLRLIGFRIIDVEYTSSYQRRFDGKRIVRVAMLCELTGDSVLQTSDGWGKKGLIFSELAEYAPLPAAERVELVSRVTPDSYAASVYYSDVPVRSLKLTDAVVRKPALKRNEHECELRLDDRLAAPKNLGAAGFEDSVFAQAAGRLRHRLTQRLSALRRRLRGGSPVAP
ncbi:MAG TPA: methyltransferase domain-containing protein [Methylomirabilota bacterium]|jgi:2-polyprenyl-3-methyl-5-hydroxy-6-metoxy-1,4-benzoquinol methylase